MEADPDMLYEVVCNYLFQLELTLIKSHRINLGHSLSAAKVYWFCVLTTTETRKR